MVDEQIEALYPLTFRVRRLFHRLGHDITALHADTGISAGMRAVLESVIDGGPQAVPELARARARPVSRQHIQGLVNALVDAGLAETVENPAHRRSRLIRATDAGRSMFTSLRSRETAAFRRLPLEVAAAELNLATRVLAAVQAALDSPEWRGAIADAGAGIEEQKGKDQ